MKTFITGILLSILIAPATARTAYDIGGKFHSPVTKDVLNKAVLISDFVDGYPVNWINDYVSVKITAINGKDENDANGQNNSLTKDQKSLLGSVTVGSEIKIKVIYKYPNSVTGIKEVRDVNISLTVIPFQQASFAGGANKMKTYFETNEVNEISKQISKTEHNVKVNFTVNSDGKISNVRLIESSGDADMDIKILKALKEMPAWKPAENSDGSKINQDFQFTVFGMNGC